MGKFLIKIGAAFVGAWLLVLAIGVALFIFFLPAIIITEVLGFSEFAGQAGILFSICFIFALAAIFSTKDQDENEEQGSTQEKN